MVNFVRETGRQLEPAYCEHYGRPRARNSTRFYGLRFGTVTGIAFEGTATGAMVLYRKTLPTGSAVTSYTATVIAEASAAPSSITWARC